MKNITIVTDIRFWENTYGSHSRIRQLLRSLLKEFQVTLFLLRTISDNDYRQISKLELPGDFRAISYKSYSGYQPNYTRSLSKNSYFKGKEVVDFTSSLHEYLRENETDAVIFEYLKYSYMSDACLPGTLKVLDMHDVMSARTVSLRKAGLKASIEMDARTEKEILSRFDKVLAISRADIYHCKNLLGVDNAMYVPYAANVRSRSDFGDGTKLLMVGANSEANVVGTRWFINQIFKMLDSRFELHMVGNICDSFSELSANKSLGRIELHGQQDDLDAHLDAADIAINPVFVGGGLKIKCVDALSSGLPCVTTPEGAAGLERAQHSGLIVAQNRIQFARALMHLSLDKKSRRAASMSASNFMRREFSADTVYSSLINYLSA